MNSSKFKNLSKICTDLYNDTGDNITAVGHGLKIKNGKILDEWSIIFTVEKKIPRELLSNSELIPPNIIVDNQEFKTDVIEAAYGFASGSIYDPYTKQTFNPGNRAKIRPLKGGISATNYTSLNNSVGTLGLIAVDELDDSIIGLSNAHVFVNDILICSERDPADIKTNVKLNDITQPNEIVSQSLENSIGIVKRYVPLFSNSPNYVDAAICSISKDSFDANESYLQYGLNYNIHMPFATTEEINSLSTNSFLYSSGRATGAKGEGDKKLRFAEFVSSLTVSDYNSQSNTIDFDFNNCLRFVAVSESPSSPGVYNSLVEYPIDSGDSGSVLIAEIGGIRKIVGLVFAAGGTVGGGGTSYGIACRIDNVVKSMKIKALDANSKLVFSNKESVEEHLVCGLSDEPYQLVNNKKYWQVGLVENQNNCSQEIDEIDDLNPGCASADPAKGLAGCKVEAIYVHSAGDPKYSVCGFDASQNNCTSGVQLEFLTSHSQIVFLDSAPFYCKVETAGGVTAPSGGYTFDLNYQDKYAGPLNNLLYFDNYPYTGGFSRKNTLSGFIPSGANSFEFFLIPQTGNSGIADLADMEPVSILIDPISTGICSDIENFYIIESSGSYTLSGINPITKTQNPCGGGHLCNRAKFDIIISATDINGNATTGTALYANLNNYGTDDNGPGPYPYNGLYDRYSSNIIDSTFNYNLFGFSGVHTGNPYAQPPIPSGAPLYFNVSIVANESNTNPHLGITWVRILNECNEPLYSCCLGQGGGIPTSPPSWWSYSTFKDLLENE